MCTTSRSSPAVVEQQDRCPHEEGGERTLVGAVLGDGLGVHLLEPALVHGLRKLDSHASHPSVRRRAPARPRSRTYGTDATLRPSPVVRRPDASAQHGAALTAHRRVGNTQARPGEDVMSADPSSVPPPAFLAADTTLRLMRATVGDLLDRAVDGVLGRAAGVLLGRAGQRDAIDAAVVALASDDDMIVTSDAADIQRLVIASGLHVDVVPV